MKPPFVDAVRDIIAFQQLTFRIGLLDKVTNIIGGDACSLVKGFQQYGLT